MKKLTRDKPIFIVANDPLRGMGLEQVRENIHLICVDHTSIVDWLIRDNKNVFCLEKELGKSESVVRNSRLLLARPEVQNYILMHSRDTLGISFFKPLAPLDEMFKQTEIGNKRHVVILNADLRISNRLENKFTFNDLCVNHDLPIPRTIRTKISQLKYKELVGSLGARFVIQFERGWFGNHTYIINNKTELDHFCSTYTDREVKVSQYIDGKVLTVNGVVGQSTIYQTRPFLQINETNVDNIPNVRLARLPGTTVGNEWYERSDQQDQLRIDREIRSLTNKIGRLAQNIGYRGYFGLDFLVSDQGQVYVQEMNARFTASVQMITQMERDVVGASLMDAHFDAFGVELPIDVVENVNEESLYADLQGVRVVARNTDTHPLKIDVIPKNGVYRFENNDVHYVREDFDITTLGNNEMILLSVASDRVVNPDQEILQIQTRNGSKDQVIQTIKEFKSQMATTAGTN